MGEQILWFYAATAVWAVGVTNGSGQTPKQVAVRPNAPLASQLVTVDVVEHLDGRAREPMAVEHPNGTLFVSGFALTPNEPGPKPTALLATPTFRWPWLATARCTS